MSDAPLKIFVSYSHKDRKFLEEFRDMLVPAARNGVVDPWDDQKITPGAFWKTEIQRALTGANVAVLLVSKSFLASDFIHNNELPPLLDAAQHRGLILFWVYLSHCLYEQTPIAAYQAAYPIAKPLSQLTKPEREAAWSEICAKIIEESRKITEPATPSLAKGPSALSHRHIQGCVLITAALSSAQAAYTARLSTAAYRYLELADKWSNNAATFLYHEAHLLPDKLKTAAIEQAHRQIIPSLLGFRLLAWPERGGPPRDLDDDRRRPIKYARYAAQDCIHLIEKLLEGEPDFAELMLDEARCSLLGFKNINDWETYLYPTVQRLLESKASDQRDLFEYFSTM